MDTLYEHWLRGGFPEPWLSRDRSFRDKWMREYFFLHLQRDVAHLYPGLDQIKYRRFLDILPGLSGTVVNYSDVARAVSLSAPAVKDYFTIADETLLWRSLPPYLKNPLRRLIKHPKGHLRDSGLLMHGLHVVDRDLLMKHPRLGLFWEGYVIEEILKGLDAEGVGYDAYHYRTSSGGEVDLVLEGTFGLLPIEIKFASDVDAGDLRALREFIEEKKCDFGLVIHQGERVRRYSDKILGVPVSCL
jgi:predicted AAA+ superfamily ATPase